MKRKLWKINRFHGGIADNKYFGESNQGAWISHCDIDSEVGVLKQQIDLTDDGTGLDTDPQIKAIIYANADSKVYGLGEDSTSKACIYSKGISSILTGSWTKDTTVSNGALMSDNQMFLEYNDYLYFTEGGDITRYGALSGTPSLTEGWGATNFGSAIDAEGGLVAHSYIYFHHGNKLASWDGSSTYNANALDIDEDYIIQDLSLDVGGNNILIAAHRGGNTYGNSQLYVWDRTSASYNYVIPIPDGIVKSIENMGNYVRILCVKTVGSSYKYGGVIVYDYMGGGLIKRYEHKILSATLPTLNRNSVYVDNNIIYFGLSYGDESTYSKSGIYRFGQVRSGLPETFLLEKLAIGTSGHEAREIYALNSFNGLRVCSYLNDTDSVTYVSKTQNGYTKNFNSTYESLLLETDTENKIHKIQIKTNPLPSGVTITVKYKVNEASSWTTVGTMTTAGDTYKNFFADANGDFNNFRSLQLQVTMTGGDSETKIKEIKTFYDELGEV